MQLLNNLKLLLIYNVNIQYLCFLFNVFKYLEKKLS